MGGRAIVLPWHDQHVVGLLCKALPALPGRDPDVGKRPRNVSLRGRAAHAFTLDGEAVEGGVPPLLVWLEPLVDSLSWALQERRVRLGSARLAGALLVGLSVF